MWNIRIGGTDHEPPLTLFIPKETTMSGKNYVLGYFRSALAMAAVLAIGSPGTSVAASACQGLSESACKGNSECTWMSGYTRKDGVAVSAHCRSKGKASGAAQESEKKGSAAEGSGTKAK
jgi:hypothetical protein